MRAEKCLSGSFDVGPSIVISITYCSRALLGLLLLSLDCVGGGVTAMKTNKQTNKQTNDATAVWHYVCAGVMGQLNKRKVDTRDQGRPGSLCAATRVFLEGAD